MTKRKSLLLILTILMAAMLSAAGISGLAAPTTVTASTPADRFEKLNDTVTVEGNKTLPNLNQFTETERKRMGVLVSSKQTGPAFRVKGDMSGMFEMRYRLYSTTDSIRDVSELYITVTDEDSGRSFTVYMDSRGTYEYVRTGVYMDEERSKLYSYNSGAVAPDADGVTRGSKNSYTTPGQTGGLYHTVTFSNDNQLGETGKAESMVPGTVAFNPQTMEVLAVTQDNWWRLADLDDETQMTNVKKGIMKGFERYSVSVSMTVAAPQTDGREGKMLVYSLNGQQMIPSSGVRGFKNTAGPTIGAKASSKALTGRPYTVKPALAYDVIDGYVGYSGAPSVTAPDGSAVSLSGSVFTPQVSGFYRVTFPLSGAKDSQNLLGNDDNYYNAKLRIFEDGVGKENSDDNPGFLPYGKTGSDGNVSYLLEAVSSHPGAPSVAVSGLSPATDLPIGGKLTLPSALCYNPLGVTAFDRLAVTLSVQKAGGTPTVLKEDAREETDYVFAEEGVYTVNYRAVDPAGVSGERMFEVNVSKDVPAFEIDPFPYLVSKGDSFTVPGATAQSAVQSFEVTAEIFAPDGSKMTASEGKILADAIGRYEIRFTAKAGNLEYLHNEYFEVRTKTDTLFENVRASEIKGNVNAPEYAGDWRNNPYNGVKVTANANNATVKFKNAVNLKDCNQDVPFLEFLVAPRLQKDDNGNYKYNYDMTVLEIRLTDIYDPTNTITVNIRAVTSRGLEYASVVKAGAGENVPGGLGWDNRTLYTASWSGTDMTTSFHGMPIERAGVLDKTAHAGRIYFNYATKELFVEHTMGTAGMGADGVPMNRVIKFDDPNIVGVGKEWRGFTTGDVYVSLSAQELTSTSADYMVLSMNGVKLSGDTLSSGKEPVFQVDRLGQTENPQGEVGTPYPVFAVDAVDIIDGKLPVRSQVFYRKGESDERIYPIGENRTFTPDQTGIYTVVYSSGAFSHTEQIEIVDKIADPIYIFDGDKQRSGVVGSRVSIPSGHVENGSGDNKTVKLSVKRWISSQKQEPVDVENNSFLPAMQGCYIVTVDVKDYLGKTYSESYEIKVTYDRTPVVTDLPSIPKALQMGKRFVFPEMSALDYFSNKENPTLVSADIFVGGTKLGGDRAYTPNAEGTLNVLYRAKNKFDEGVVEKSFAVQVIDYSDAYKGDYFYKTGTFFPNVISDSYAGISTKDLNAGLQFANKLVADGMRFDFVIPREYMGYSRLNITLTDSVNAYVKVTVGVVKDADGSSYLEVNGVRGGALNGEFGNADKVFSVLYHADGYKFLNASDAEVGIARYTDYNEKFTGFPSGKVYLDLSFAGVTGTAGLRVRSLNGQLFDDSKGDYVNPNIMIQGSVPKTAAIGELIEIPYAIAGDVLDPDCVLKMAVLAPDGSFAMSPTEAVPGKSFAITAYGNYTIRYTASDSNGNEAILRYTVLVSDLIPPVIRLSGSVPDSGSVNRDIKLPTASVSDNNDKDLPLYVFVVEPDAKMTVVTDFVFRPSKAGTYTVYYFAEDKSYSYTCLTYTVTVK